MFRMMLALLVAFGIVAGSFADPVKKTAKADSEKLTKECGDAFFKAIVDGKADDAMKLCATPFLEPNGKVVDSLDNLKQMITQPPPPGFEVKVTDAVALDQFNEWSKKKGGKVLNADELKQYAKFLGEEGRIVILEFKEKGQVQKIEGAPHLLIRIKDGKAQIVGIGGR